MKVANELKRTKLPPAGEEVMGRIPWDTIPHARERLGKIYVGSGDNPGWDNVIRAMEE